LALFLTILEGDTPEEAKLLIATQDKDIIRLVTTELSRRFDPLSINPAKSNPNHSRPAESGVRK
jgi:hypothetical protein